MRDYAPCGACGALVPVATGCAHWPRGEQTKVGKPGRVPGRSPGAKPPDPITPSDHANALAARLIEVLAGPALTPEQTVG